jgi:CubicO group peptidase (beta-lactamase class C family)
MKRLHTTLILILAFSLIASAAYAAGQAKPGDLAGHWEGTIEIPGQKLEVNLDFTKQADGSWKGDISIPAQNARDLPLAGIEVKEAEVVFAIAGVPGNPTFKGKFSEDGKKITGTFTQGGASFPFSLSREADPAAKVKESLKGFDEVIKQALDKLKVPGAAVAVVRYDQLVFSGGFGLRDVENKLPMTADSLLAIGSCTKAFTTFVLGTLVDEGKVEWEKPVRNYIPWFKLYDAQAGERLTPRDLVTHRSGLPRHDLAWYNNENGTREDLVRRLAYLPPTADLRTRYQYNNLMFTTAGYLIETLTGRTWEDAVKERIFGPLGMSRTNFSVEASQKDKDFAFPYDERKGKLEKIPFRSISVVGPAGSINSSVNEMSRWLMVHLNAGKYGDRQVISAAVLNDLHTPYMTTGAQPTSPHFTSPDYALGWMVDTYRGRRRVHHGGNIDGFSAMVTLLPNDGLGFVVLANKNGTPLNELVIRTAIDRILGLEAVDWVGDAVKRMAEGEEIGKKAEQKKATRRRPGTKPSHKLEEYAGVYNHPGYGDLEVQLKGTQLAFVYNRIATPLEHWHYETFSGLEAPDPTFKDFKLTFITDVDGNVSALKAAFEPTLDQDIVFVKRPEARLSDPEYLKKVAGTYELMTQRVQISLKGDRLTMFVPGQPVYDLVPKVGGEYYLKQVPIISVRFIEDAKGAVTGLESFQPDGVYEFKRVKD